MYPEELAMVRNICDWSKKEVGYITATYCRAVMGSSNVPYSELPSIHGTNYAEGMRGISFVFINL